LKGLYQYATTRSFQTYSLGPGALPGHRFIEPRGFRANGEVACATASEETCGEASGQTSSEAGGASDYGPPSDNDHCAPHDDRDHNANENPHSRSCRDDYRFGAGRDTIRALEHSVS
jgi:hypothetical protein